MRIAVAALAACAALAAPVSASAGGWLPPTQLSEFDGGAPQIELLATGETIVGWAGPFAIDPDGRRGAEWRIRPPGGAFGPLVRQEAFLYGFVEGPAGHVLRVTSEGVSLRPPGGDFGPTVKPPVEYVNRNVTALDENGDAVFLDVREQRDPSTGETRSEWLEVVTLHADGRVSGPVKVADTRGLLTADLALLPDGGVLVAWTAVDQGPPSDPQRVRVAEGRGDSFSEAVVLSEPFRSAWTRMEILSNARGDAVVAWEQTSGTPSYVQPGALRARFRPAGATAFGPEETPPGPDDRAGDLYRFDLALSERGDFAAVWTDAGTTTVAYRRPGGPFEAARSIVLPHFPGESTGGRDRPPVYEPAVDVDAEGNAIAVALAGNRQAPVSLRREADGSWGAPQTILVGPIAYLPDVVLGPGGTATAVWGHSGPYGRNGGDTLHGMWSAEYDPAAPSLSRVAVADAPAKPAVAFALTEPAKVTVTLERRARKYVRLGAFRVNAKAGTSAARIPSKLVRKLRVPGRYRATIVARDRAGNTGKAKRVAFGALR